MKLISILAALVLGFVTLFVMTETCIQFGISVDASINCGVVCAVIASGWYLQSQYRLRRRR